MGNLSILALTVVFETVGKHLIKQSVAGISPLTGYLILFG